MKRISILYLCLALLLWQVTAMLGIYSDLFFPSPAQVAQFFIQGFFCDGVLWTAIGISCERLFIGFFITLALGIPLGFCCYHSEFLQQTLHKIALGLQTLPSVCWVPLTLLWFGQNDTSIIFVVCMGSIWGLILGTEQGIKNVPSIFIKAARTMGARGFVLWRTVLIPAAFPALINTIKQSWAFAWRSLLSAEIYIITIHGLGLGQLLHYGREMQAMNQVIGIILILIALGLFIDQCFAAMEDWVEKRWGR